MTGTPYRLLSLPPDLVGSFHSITDLNAPEWYCTSDPAGVKVGSGGGTAWLVDSWLKDTRGVDMSDPKIIIHAGVREGAGQAVSGGGAGQMRCQ